MVRFGVWAPEADSLEVEVLGLQRYAMEKQPSGWWYREVAAAEDHADYGFRVNGGPLRPDPRSLWQPAGVHGPSRVVDHSRFKWTDQHWQAPPISGGVLYELHIGTFTPAGTFEAAIEKLPSLVELGITHLQLMPVAEFAGDRGWGYDGVAPFACRNRYGGPDGLKRLVDACHRLGIAVLLDVVYNHLGPLGNYLGDFGPYFTFRYSTPWGAALNYDDEESDEVRRYFCDNALMWFKDYHIDGLRLDAVHAIFDNSATHLIEQLAQEVDELQAHLQRHLTLVAESDLNAPKITQPRSHGGYGVDAQWVDDFHHALRSLITGDRSGYYTDFGSLDTLAQTLKSPYFYRGQYSQHRRRSHGRTILGASGHKFVSYTQNHDQVGNSPRGERLHQLVSLDRVKIATALLLTSPYIPQLFQGEEWAASTPFQYFIDFSEEPDLAVAVREGRRNELSKFKWDRETIPDPQAETTFEDSKLRWEEIAAPMHAQTLAWYRDLIRLRRAYPELTDGRFDLVDTQHDTQQNWLTVQRRSVVIACNFSIKAQAVPLPEEDTAYEVLLASKEVELLTDSTSLMLPAESVAILQIVDNSAASFS